VNAKGWKRMTHMGVKEQAIHSPRKRLVPPIHILIPWNFGEVSVVFGPQMVQMLLMFNLSIVNPGTTHGDWT